MLKIGKRFILALIIKWNKNAGDFIKMDETLLEIATDKVDSEVPSTAEGTIAEVLYHVNDVVPVGAVIARIKTGVAEDTEQTNKEHGTRNEEYSEQRNKEPRNEFGAGEGTRNEEVKPQQEIFSAQDETRNEKQETLNGSGVRFYSPLVLNIAGQEGVSMTELEKIPGTGNEGRVTKKDILQYVSDKRAGKVQSTQFTVQQPAQQQPQQATREESKLPSTVNSQTPTTYSGNVEIIEMDRMRKLIADHMVRSKHTSPHVTSFTEADVTNLVMWREKAKKEFEKREGTKITFTPLFIEAIVRCIKKFPMINSSLDGANIIVKKDINIGMATALPTGNLIVPVIKNADQLNLVGLAKRVNGLADAARNNKLKPEDISDGTFTLTNVGTFGSLMGTPIINQPQVAILAVGAIKKRPVVIETPHGDSIAIRHMMYLSMSYDHRVVDGSLGATFLTAVANELENFNANREF